MKGSGLLTTKNPVFAGGTYPKNSTYSTSAALKHAFKPFKPLNKLQKAMSSLAKPRKKRNAISQ